MEEWFITNNYKIIDEKTWERAMHSKRPRGSGFQHCDSHLSFPNEW